MIYDICTHIYKFVVVVVVVVVVFPQQGRRSGAAAQWRWGVGGRINARFVCL